MTCSTLVFACLGTHHAEAWRDAKAATEKAHDEVLKGVVVVSDGFYDVRDPIATAMGLFILSGLAMLQSVLSPDCPASAMHCAQETCASVPK